MGTTACCKFNKNMETELRAARGNDKLFKQGTISDPEEIDQRFEKLIDAFPFALERIIVCSCTNLVHRKREIFLDHLILISARILRK